MMFDELMERKSDLISDVDEAVKQKIAKLDNQPIYFTEPWDLRNNMDSESDMARSLQFFKFSGGLIPTIHSDEGSEQVGSLDLDNALSLLAVLEEGSYQTTPLDDNDDEPEQELPYSVHEAYSQE